MKCCMTCVFLEIISPTQLDHLLYHSWWVPKSEPCETIQSWASHQRLIYVSVSRGRFPLKITFILVQNRQSVTIPWASLRRFYVKAAYFSNLHLIRCFVQCPSHLNVVIIALTIRPLWARMTTMAILSVYGLTVSHSNLLLWKNTKAICSRMLLYFKINFVTNSILLMYSENSCHWR